MPKRAKSAKNTNSNNSQTESETPESSETNSELENDTEMLTAEAEDDDSAEADALAADGDVDSDSGDADDEAQASSANGAKIDKRTLPKGPRQVFFACSAYVENVPKDLPEQDLKKGDSGLVLAEIDVTMPAQAKAFFDVDKAKLEAIKIFTSEYGEEPTRVGKPSYHYLGEKTKPSKPRDSVKMDDDVEFTTQKATAIHMVKDIPWNVMVTYTNKPGEVFVMYKNIAGSLPPGRKKPATPPHRGLRESALIDIKPIDKSQPSA